MPKRLTILLTLLVLLGLISLLLFFSHPEPSREEWSPEPPPRHTAPVSELPLLDRALSAPSSDRPAPRELSLFVELIERAREMGGNAEASQIGRTSALSGAVSDAWGAPFEGAKLRFIAGMNTGYQTIAGIGGRYEFFSLFPGLHQLRIESRAGTIVREVRLRPDAQENVDFPFGAPATVTGKVVDRKGKAIENAKIEIDERFAWTDREGVFVLTGVTPGDAVIYASGDRYGYYRQNLNIPPNYSFEPGRLQIVLGPGGTLNGGVYPFGGQEPAQLYLVPGVSNADRSIPYEKFAGLEAVAGGSFSIPNVPAETSLLLLAYHPRSAAQPQGRPILLRGRTENIVKLDFRFASIRPVKGEVRSASSGEPIHRARVRVFAKNPYASVAQVLRVAGPGMGSFLAPALPFCRREVFTDPAGKFFLETGDGAVRSEAMTLLVEADGHLPFEKAITSEAGLDLPIVLYTADSLIEKAALVFSFQGGVPARISLTLNGVAKAAREIEGDRSLALEDLAPGVYRVELRGGEATLLYEARLPVTGRKEIEVFLRR